MEKIVKAYCFPEMERARLMVTQNRIQLNKFGVNWLNSKYVQLVIKEDRKQMLLLITGVDGRSPMAFKCGITLTLQDRESLSKIRPDQIANGNIKQINYYGQLQITKDGKHALIFTVNRPLNKFRGLRKQAID